MKGPADYMVPEFEKATEITLSTLILPNYVPTLTSKGKIGGVVGVGGVARITQATKIFDHRIMK